MKAMVCEMCGSNSLVKQDGLFVCQHCNTKYSTEDAKKLIVDISGSTVKLDSSEEINNLYELARRAKAENNSENAQKYYSQIIVKDPSSWEANFYSTYYQSMNCKIAEIGIAAIRISNCEETVFKLIKENVTNSNERREAVDEVASKLIHISSMLFNAYKNHYDRIGYQIQSKYTQEYVNNCAASRDIVYNSGNWIVQIFGDEYGDIAASCWEVGVYQHNILMINLRDKEGNADVIQNYIDKIAKYDTSYQAPKINTTSGGCYVATAVYGSYDCPQVWTLRRYRDDTLAKTWYGRVFVRTYYAISPTLVKWFGNTDWFRNMWKPKLDRMVSNLKSNGVKDTPYEDKNW